MEALEVSRNVGFYFFLAPQMVLFTLSLVLGLNESRIIMKENCPFLLIAPQVKRVAGVLLLTLTLTSCYLMKSPEKRVAENRDYVQREFQGEVRRQLHGESGGVLKLTWNEALEEMYMHNPKLLQADFKVEDAVDQQKQVYTNLIPLLTVGASSNFEIKDIDKAFDDVRLRVYSYLPLGDLVRMPKQIYKRKLMYLGAQLQAELTMRQEVIALYRLFQQERLLTLEKKALTVEGAIAQSMVGVGGEEEFKARKNYEKALEALEKRQEEWRLKVSDFFMSDFSQINLIRKGMPEITYTASEIDFTDTNRWGMLQMNLLALEKIAEDSRMLSIYLRYLPRPDFSVSAPPLYSDTGGGFDPEAIRLGPSMNWQLDTRGTITKQLNRIHREAPLRDWRKDKRRRSEIKKLLDAKKALEEVQTELNKLRKAMEGYKSAVKGGLVKDPQKAILTMRKLREQEVRLAAKKIEICTSFWLIDETRWKQTSKRWQETRKIRAKKRKEELKLKKKR